MFTAAEGVVWAVITGLEKYLEKYQLNQIVRDGFCAVFLCGFVGGVARSANQAGLTGWRGRDTLGFMQIGGLKFLYPTVIDAISTAGMIPAAAFTARAGAWRDQGAAEGSSTTR